MGGKEERQMLQLGRLPTIRSQKTNVLLTEMNWKGEAQRYHRESWVIHQMASLQKLICPGENNRIGILLVIV